MAVTVKYHAPSPVKITHVTYRVVHVWSVNTDFMAITVQCRVPPTVKTTSVTGGAGHAMHVNLGGLECSVNQVMLLVKFLKTINLTKVYVQFCYH